MQTSELILLNLLKNEEYVRRVIPFLEEDYFQKTSEKHVFKNIKEYVAKYNASPTMEALYIELSNDKSVNESSSGDIDLLLDSFKISTQDPQLQWLLDTTENFCKERAIHNAIYESISIIEGSHRSMTTGAIPEIVSKALAVSFNHSIGHDYLDDAERRFEFYHRAEEKVPLALDMMNRITKGGFSNKTLNLFLSATHGGKSAMMCFLAAQNLMDGKNVLYVSLEMAEEEIARRIDANLMNVTLDELRELPQKMYDDRILKLRTKTTGKLIIKEYPTAGAHIGHLRALLNELLLKRDFKPDIVYIDYLNIMTSFRIKPGTVSNTYVYNKAISEEVRGLAIEVDCPFVSASQFNRGGAVNSDPNMEDISESFGVNFTADFIAALISSDELIKQNLMMVKQLKSRYDDKNRIPKFFVGFDRQRMQFSNVADPLAGIIQETMKSNNNSTYSSSSSSPPWNTGGGSSAKRNFSGFS
jgi:replicative DNA helicase